MHFYLFNSQQFRPSIQIQVFLQPNMKLVLKWKEEIKLFASELHYQMLVGFISAGFGLKQEGIEITYVDQDGDNITVASQDDLLLLSEYFAGKEYVKLSVQGQVKEVVPVQAVVAEPKEDKKEDAPKKKKKNSQKVKKEKNPSKPKEATESNNSKEKKEKEKPEKKEKLDNIKQSDNHSEQIKGLLNLTVIQMVDQRIKTLLPCMREQLQNPQKQQRVESDIVQEGLSCSLCGVKPITGFRYDCPSCAGFSICSHCEDISIHQHNLLKIRHLSQPKAPKASKNIEKICKIIAKQAQQQIKDIQKMEKKEQLKEKQKIEQKEKIKEAKRYLSQLLGQQPKVFNDFVKKNKKASLEDIVKLYTESIQLSTDDYKEKLVDLQARRLAKKFKKQPECYNGFVREHLHFDFNTVLEAAYKSGIEKKQKKVEKTEIAEMAKEEVKTEVKEEEKAEEKEEEKEEEKAPYQPFASNHSSIQQPEPKAQVAGPVRKNSSSLRKPQVLTQLKGQKLQTLKLMIEFFGLRNQLAYERFIEQNEKHGKESILQKWADKFSVIQP